MDAQIDKVYGKKLRVRICGICWQDDKLLLVNHRRLAVGNLWAPPGGGLEFGESVDDRLRTEFIEETGLVVVREAFAFACEFRQDPLHAIELFFQVKVTGGSLRRGADPELDIIGEAKYMSAREISALPAGSRHGIFSHVPSAEALKTLTGFYTI